MMNRMNLNARSVTSKPLGIKQSHPLSFGATINKQLVKDMLDIIPKNHRSVVMTNPEMGRLIVSKKVIT